MSKKVVVFGGSGFLGSHVADALTAAGFEVTIFDLRPSPWLQKDQKMITGDILDEKAVRNAVQGMDYVYNFAGIADIDECVARPLDTVRYNILGNAIITDSAARARCRRFVFASSAYVYSDAGHFYRSSKQPSESLIEDYAHNFNLEYTILRHGSLYGERADERKSIYRILKQALLEKRIDYSGTGEEIREYIHVLDAARASVEILKPEFVNQRVMLTGVRAMRYGEMLEMIREILHHDIEINYRPSRSATHYRITPYNFSPKLGRKLLVNPHVDLGQGLLDTLDHIYRKHQHPELKDGTGLPTAPDSDI